MYRRTMLMAAALMLLVTMSLLACSRDAEGASAVQPSSDGTQAATEAAVQTPPTEPDETDPAETEPEETVPATTEFDWGIGEEDLGDFENDTKPAAPSETKPSGNVPAGTEPAETEAAGSDWEIGEEDF